MRELVKNRGTRLCVVIVVAVIACECCAAAQSQSASPDKPAAAGHDEGAPASATESLQKATQNPVANLISVAAQNNTNFGMVLMTEGRAS